MKREISAGGSDSQFHAPGYLSSHPGNLIDHKSEKRKAFFAYNNTNTTPALPRLGAVADMVILNWIDLGKENFSLLILG